MMPWIEERDNIGEWYTMEGCAKRLGLTKKSIAYRVMKYRLNVVRVGNVDLVRLDDVANVPLYGRGEG